MKNFSKQLIILEPSFRFEPEALLYFSSVTANGFSLDQETKLLYNSLIKELKNNGQWSLLDTLFIDATVSKNAALVDIKTPSRIAVITNDYAGSFTAPIGFNGNASFRINTNFNPGDGGTYNYTQNSASHAVYLNSTDNLSTYVDVSAETGAYIGLGITALFGSGKATRAGTSGNFSTSNGSSQQGYGFHGAKCFSNILQIVHKNGVLQNDAAVASAAIPNLNITRFCRNLNGVFSLYSQRKQSAYYAGGNLNDALVQTAIEKFLIAKGAAPKKQVLIHGNSFTATATYVNKFFGYYTASNLVAGFVKGTSGITTPSLTAEFSTYMQPAVRSYYTNQILFIWELTNDFATNGNDVTLTYNNLVAYCNQARAAGVKKIVVGTMLPRGSVGANNALRQNDADLYDNATLNGKIRNNYLSFADGIADAASDPIMGIYSNGVPGVGERNTTYYLGDQLHPTTTGYNYLADNYVYPAINSFL